METILDYNKFVNKLNESMSNDSEFINKIDYTLLKPESTENDIIDLCKKAEFLGVKSVCVLPKMVKTASEALKDSDILVCTVISFPHGTDTTEDKIAEAQKAISDGADEIDMVLNYPLLKEALENIDDYQYLIKDVEDDVERLVKVCLENTNKNNDTITLKVIVESGLLTAEETAESTLICINAGANFIKTSTGMVSVGAELEKVKIMKDIINDEKSNLKIKVSGGLRTMEDLEKFDTYADRFGVGSSSVDSIFNISENINNDNY